MSTAQFTTPLIVTIPGQLITASLWNNEYVNLFTNLNPLGIGAYSDTDPQMQTSTDPFPSGTSRPTSIGGELERIRYILNLIIGQTYWYQHPSISLETLNTSTPVIPSGTKMLFFQAAAPTGWTQDTTNDDAALRVVSSAGGGTGGTNALSTGLAHTHTMANHTHDLANHTHTMGNHTHSTPAHQHPLDYTTSVRTNQGGGVIVSADSDGSSLVSAPTTNTVLTRTHTNQTTSGGTGTSGSPSTNTTAAPSVNTSGTPSTNTSDSTSPTFKYIDIIVCSKD